MIMERLIRELGLENRVYLLKKLRAKPCSVSEVRQELKRRGIKKPFSTVGRYLDSLLEQRLLVEQKGRYSLSIKGRLVLGYLEEMGGRLQALEKVENVVCEYSLEYLPEEFVRGASVLGKAEVILEPFEVMWGSVKAIEKAEEVRVLNKGVMNREFLELALARCLGGLRVTAVVDGASVPERVRMMREIIEAMGAEGFPRDNFVVKSLEEVPLNLMIVDDKGAGLSLPAQEDRNSLIPAFKSEDKEFIMWVKGIFEWYWERGEVVGW
jgi:predicted transcriptional regulator